MSDIPTELETIFNTWGTDKSRTHKYHIVYEPVFEKLRDQEINVLEIGCWDGASTKALFEYFPKANIYTIDIFTRNHPSHIGVLKEERVHWIKGDSTVASIVPRVRKQWEDVKFDIIIDDGAHRPLANMLTLRNLMQFLKEDGVYFIEDVWPMERMSFEELGFAWLKDNPQWYNHLDNNAFLGELDKYWTTRHDLRKVTGKGDSYIIEVQHP